MTLPRSVWILSCLFPSFALSACSSDNDSDVASVSNSEAERKAEKKADADEQKAAEQPGNGADNSTGNDNPTN
ncbi:MAG: hypothetical protein RJA70_2607, partial [Pseudomonadota bacterium]